jgi:arginine deiminase
LLALDEGVVLSPARNKEVNTQLKTLGFEVIEIGLDDLLKGGGGPHCMGFPIKRE